MNGSLSDESLWSASERIVFEWCSDKPVTASDKATLVRRLFYSFRGLDVLQPLIDDPDVTEIMINGPDHIFIEKRGQLSRWPAAFENEERLHDLIQSIVSSVNRTVNESTPIVDARLKDGSRVHAVLPPVALHGPSLTIRKFPEKPLDMASMIRMGATSADAAALLEQLVKAKYNVFVSGGTGSGKTTLLNAMSRFIPADERVITIEDSAELQIRTVPNLVSLETRNANTEGKGEISIRELIRASLRMRPNRIIVGEVRGAEALDMLQALNTGHDGSMSTGHANSAKDMLSRLETMALGAAALPLAVIRQQIASGIDIIVHLARLRDRSRRMTEICEVVGIKGGEVELVPLYQFVESGERDGKVRGELLPTGAALRCRHKWEMAGLAPLPICGGGMADETAG
ncbi:CpaF family protein [Paenibacillus sp. MMS18-CY102]|uniref:CpaF family protein n=1 Tax=Paenibacillus sp. MMS18-CY102 TaxID=2682849 RepID=UPI0013652E9F|nr:CpaF family protein [Paenibacillus sp. MMS18-CY102]MWC30108.1 CpaF family protein [Paenibacillus sp. MMS18-CY102]